MNRTDAMKAFHAAQRNYLAAKQAKLEAYLDYCEAQRQHSLEQAEERRQQGQLTKTARKAEEQARAEWELAEWTEKQKAPK